MFIECCFEPDSGLATAIGGDIRVRVPDTGKTSQWKIVARLIHESF